MISILSFVYYSYFVVNLSLNSILCNIFKFLASIAHAKNSQNYIKYIVNHLSIRNNFLCIFRKMLYQRFVLLCIPESLHLIVNYQIIIFTLLMLLDFKNLKYFTESNACIISYIIVVICCTSCTWRFIIINSYTFIIITCTDVILLFFFFSNLIHINIFTFRSI